MEKKAQISMIDLAISVVLFIAIFALLRNVWSTNISTSIQEITFSEMQVRAQQAADTLLRTPGYPSTWTSGTVELIGLADKPGIISQTKLTTFRSMDYNVIADKLSLGKYDYFFSLKPTAGSDINFGVVPKSGKMAASVERVVSYNGGDAIVTFKVFSNQ